MNESDNYFRDSPEDRELEIIKLQKRIEELKNQKPINYELVKVVPDCGAGIKDSENTIAISEDISKLVTYCVDRFNYSPKFERDKSDGKSPCDAWYKLAYTKIQIIN